MRQFGKIAIFAFIIYFFSWLVIYKSNINPLAIQSEDTLPAMFLPVSIIKEGTLYLDSYYQMLVLRYPHPDDKSYLKGLTPFYLKKVNSHYASAFPIITPLLALPVYLIPVLLGIEITWESLTVLSHVSAALIMSLAGGFFYLLLKKHFLTETVDRAKVRWLTLVYLFGTINFALFSQSLWQHGTLQLFVILALYFLLFIKTKLDNLNMFLSGLFFGLAILSRPTAVLALLVLPFVVFSNYSVQSTIKEKVKALSFLVFGLLINVCFFAWYNSSFYLSIGNQGYSGQIFNSWLGGFPLSFLGVWFSPSKGILIYSPVLVFALIGTFLVLRNLFAKTAEVASVRSNKNYVYLAFALVVFIHTLIISFWKHWYGGYSFGYRMSSDVIPFLVLLLVPFVSSHLYKRYMNLFIFFVLISIFIQFFGLAFFDGIWHAAYDKGFTDTAWLWSLNDSEFMFNMRRVLVKIGYLDKACPVCLPGK